MGCGLTLPLMVTGSPRDTLRRWFLRLEKGEAEEQMLFVPVPHVHACPQNYLQRVPTCEWNLAMLVPGRWLMSHSIMSSRLIPCMWDAAFFYFIFVSRNSHTWCGYGIGQRNYRNVARKLLIFFNLFFSELNCFTILYPFLLCSKVNQLYLYIYPLLFGFPSCVGHRRMSSRVPWAIQQVLVSCLFFFF